MAKYLEVAATFDARHRLDDDFEVIPIPGHTEGATAYLWKNGGERFLFTGDSLYLSHGEWRGALPSRATAAYIASLERLAGLDFDQLVPWAASLDGPARSRPAGPTPPNASAGSSTGCGAGATTEMHSAAATGPPPLRAATALTLVEIR